MYLNWRDKEELVKWIFAINCLQIQKDRQNQNARNAGRKWKGSVILFLLVTETFSGTVQYSTVVLILTLLLGGYSVITYDTFLRSFGWTADRNYFFSLLSVGKALHSSLKCEETEGNKKGESVRGL